MQYVLTRTREFYHAQCLALTKRSPLDPDIIKKFLIFDVFCAKYKAAVDEEDSTPLYTQLAIAIKMLTDILHHKGEPTTWDEETLESAAVQAQRINTTAKLLQLRISTKQAAATLQAEATTMMDNLRPQLQGTIYAAPHDRRQCASQPDPGSRNLHPAPTPQPDEESLRASAGEAPGGV
jgi:hypothetical protein